MTFLWICSYSAVSAINSSSTWVEMVLWDVSFVEQEETLCEFIFDNSESIPSSFLLSALISAACFS